jgi:hypothetical protein
VPTVREQGNEPRAAKACNKGVHNGRNGRYKGHYRTENCTKQEAPPEDKQELHLLLK